MPQKVLPALPVYKDTGLLQIMPKGTSLNIRNSEACGGQTGNINRLVQRMKIRSWQREIQITQLFLS